MTADIKQYVLTDDEIDAAQKSAYHALLEQGYNGGMGGYQWDRASARAIIDAVLSKLRGVGEPVGYTLVDAATGEFGGITTFYGAGCKIHADHAREQCSGRYSVAPLYAAPKVSAEADWPSPAQIAQARVEWDAWADEMNRCRNATLEQAAKVPRAYAEQLERMGWDKRFPDELCAIFNASTNMADQILALRSALAAEDRHPDDLAVDCFAAAMKSKLAKKRAEGRSGWENKEQCTAEFLSSLLREHVAKGDPVDVGNLAMMLHQRGEQIVSPEDFIKVLGELRGTRAVLNLPASPQGEKDA